MTAPLLDQTRPIPEKTETRDKRGNGGEPETALQHHGTLPHDSWQEWLTYRRKRRFPVDATTLGKHLATLAKYDTATQRAMIDASIGSGWQGIFDPKGKAAAPSAAPSKWQPPPDDPDVQH